MKKETVRQVGYLQRLYRDAGQQNMKFISPIAEMPGSKLCHNMTMLRFHRGFSQPALGRC
jgi:hypothetical protein